MSRQSNWVTGLGGQSERSDYYLSLPLLCTLWASVSVLQAFIYTFQNTFPHT